MFSLISTGFESEAWDVEFVAPLADWPGSRIAKCQDVEVRIKQYLAPTNVPACLVSLRS